VLNADDKITNLGALRKHCKKIGLTPAMVGMTIDDLIEKALTFDDPKSWLASWTNAPPDDEPLQPVVVADKAAGASPSIKTMAGKAPSPPRTDHHGLPLTSISVTLPFAVEMPPGYRFDRTHIEIHLTREAAAAFIRLRAALNQTNARRSTGRHVGENNAAVIEWLFEQLAESLAKEAGKETYEDVIRKEGRG